MALQQINVGTNPDDGTGDSLRAACVKINAMFTELYSSVTSLLSSVAGKAGLTQIVRIDSAQTLTAAQKLRAAINAGTLLPMWVELVAPDAPVVAADHVLFTLPNDFIFYDAKLTFAITDNGAVITATLFQEPPGGEQDTVYAVGGAISQRVFPLGVTGAGILLEAGTKLILTVSDVSDFYEAETSGLGVWIRGVWA